MARVIETVKKIYTSEGAAVKHICWLVLAILGTILSMQPTTTASPTPADLLGLLAGSAISIIYGLALTIYTFGYNCIIMHNRFQEEGKPLGFSILPEFDILPFKIFGRAIVLIIVWLLWSIIISLAAIVPLVGIIFCMIVMPFIGFVQVAYSKEFKTDGLFSLAILSKFLRLFWIDAVWWWFRLFLLGLGIYAILGILCGALGLFDMNMLMTGQIPQSLNFVFAILQYISIVLGFVNAYGMADIFIKKWDNSSY